MAVAVTMPPWRCPVRVPAAQVVDMEPVTEKFTNTAWPGAAATIDANNVAARTETLCIILDS